MLKVNRWNRTSRLQKKNRKSMVLRCEALEDRRLLAVVTSGADAGAGTLRAALAAAVPNEIITFAPAVTAVSITSGQLVVAVDGVIIDGANGAAAGGKVTVSSNGTSRVFDVNDGDKYVNTMSATIRNLTISGGGGTSYGGGIWNVEELTLNNVMITGNNAFDAGALYTGSGGGIDTDGNLTIVDSMITGNSAGQNQVVGFLSGVGGGISVGQYAQLTMTNTSVDNNSSVNAGGGVWIRNSSGPHVITGGSMSGNKSGITAYLGYTPTNADGAGLYVLADAASGATTDLTVDGTTITDNEAGGYTSVNNFSYGGGVYIRTNFPADVVNLSNLTVTGNSLVSTAGAGTSIQSGGGMMLRSVGGGTFNVSDSTISGNGIMQIGSFEYGGGVRIGSFASATSTANGYFNFDNVNIDNNTAPRGGGIASRFQGNAADQSRTILSITGGSISGNTSVGDGGGGMWVWKSQSTSLDGVTVSNNYAYNGGALFNFAGAFADSTQVDLTINNSTISGNTNAGGGGGGIEAGTTGMALRPTQFPARVTVTNSTLSDNYGLSGGAIYSYDASVYLYQVTGSDNNGPVAGGFLEARTDAQYIGGPQWAKFEIDRSTIAFNNGTDGLGIYANANTQLTVQDTIVANNTGTGSDLMVKNATAAHTRIGDSLVQTLSGVFTNTSVGANIFGVSADLGALQDNGGPTFTHLPNAGSPAINAGDPSDGMGTDQRGFSPRNVGGRMDIGSVEVGAAPPGNACDLDGDNDCDIDDLNMLTQAKFLGMATQADINNWLVDAGCKNIGRAYRGGDVDLDGQTDGQDFLEWNANKFTPVVPTLATALWSLADFDGSGNTDGADFLTWNANKFMVGATCSPSAGLQSNGLDSIFGEIGAEEGVRSLKSQASDAARTGKRDITSSSLAKDNATSMFTAKPQLRRAGAAAGQSPKVIFAAPAPVTVTVQAETMKSESGKQTVVHQDLSTPLAVATVKSTEVRRTADKVDHASAVDTLFANFG